MDERDRDEIEDDDRDEDGMPRAATEPDELEPDAVATYLIDEITRAFAAHERAAPGSVQRVLPLGEMLALFNLADQFGLLDHVRAALDRRRGANAYVAFSEAMKAALLDRGFGPGGGGGSTPPRPAGPPRQHWPPERGREGRPGAGRQGRGDGHPPRGGPGNRPPGGRD